MEIIVGMVCLSTVLLVKLYLNYKFSLEELKRIQEEEDSDDWWKQRN